MAVSIANFYKCEWFYNCNFLRKDIYKTNSEVPYAQYLNVYVVDNIFLMLQIKLV